MYSFEIETMPYRAIFAAAYRSYEDGRECEDEAVDTLDALQLGNLS
jgi:hypothetical protein